MPLVNMKRLVDHKEPRNPGEIQVWRSQSVGPTALVCPFLPSWLPYRIWRNTLRVLAKVALVTVAFAAGTAAARLLGGWDSYHRRSERDGSLSAVCRAVVLRVLDEQGDVRRLEVRMLSGERRGETVAAAQPVVRPHPGSKLGAGERCLVVLRPREGAPLAEVVCRERDAYLVGMACAVVVLLGLTAGRKGLATACSVAWTLVLLLGLLLPAAFGGARAVLWCVPLALAIAVPTLFAIGGLNRKSLGAIGGTLCGVVAGGLTAVGFTQAMSLTGLEVDFGPYHHLENLFWYSPAMARVDFASLLVAGMLLAGLGAVMDVSMAVASTVAEVRRTAPGASGWELVRAGLAAGRDILGAMVLSLGMVYVGSHLVFFVSLGRTGWASRWMQLGNYEELAAELARMAAAAVGMALCVPAAAVLTALLYGRRAAEEAGERSQAPHVGGRKLGLALRRAVAPVVAGVACLALAGLADEWTLRSYLPGRGQTDGDTVARVVAFDEPALEPTARSTDPRDRTYFRSQVVVVQPFFGPRAGEFLATLSLIGPNPSHHLPLRCGGAVHVSAREEGADIGTMLFKMPLRYRWGLVALVLVAATLILGAGRVGLRVLLVLGAGGFLMVGALIPLLSAGYPPLPVTLGFCGAMLGAVFAISGKVDRKALAACAGCATGLAAAAGLFLLSSGWMRFTGAESVSAQFLSWVAEKAGASYNYPGLLAATLLVVFFGLALDTAVTVAAGVSQVRAARPGISRREATMAGMNISRDVVGTMALTLVFAFVGLRLPVFLLPAASGLSPAELINGEAGASEILHVLVGVAALAVTGPATALLAAHWMAGGKCTEEARPRAARVPLWRTVVAIAAAVATLAGLCWWHSLRQERLARAPSPSLPQRRDELVASAHEALRDGRQGGALVALWAARERFPNDALLRTELAYAYMANRYVVQARREVEGALAAGSDDAKTHYVAGVAYAWAEEQENAEHHLRRAVQLDPSNAAARAALERLFDH